MKVYKGFRARKQLKEQKDDLPDLKAPEVALAAVRIQKVYRGFQARQKVKVLKDPEMAKAAVKIQSVYRGFQARQKPKEEKTEDDEMPDLKCPQVNIRIFQSFRICF